MASKGETRKALILAGGRGQRLAPLTFAVNKHLLPVDRVPMIYYPLALLMQLGVTEVGIVIDPRDREAFGRLLGNGEHLGLRVEWLFQPHPLGLPDGLIAAESFLGGHGCLLVLGDTLLIGSESLRLLQQMLLMKAGAAILAVASERAKCFGVVELDESGSIVDLAEKPRDSRSNLAIPGVYVLDRQVVELARGLQPSARGELEMVDLLRRYHSMGQLFVHHVSSPDTWFDLGTFASLKRASGVLRNYRREHGRPWACPEEIAFQRGDLTRAQLLNWARRHPNRYGRYLRAMAMR